MRQIKLLLVDDEEEYVRALASRLAVRGVSSRVALSGEDALRQLEGEPSDVMVLDLRMPGIDGMEVLERVRREHPHLEVVVLTGHGSPDEEARARDLGAFEYVEKPADTPQLLDTIRSAWARARARIEQSKEGFDRHMRAAAMAEAGLPDMAVEELARKSPTADAPPAGDTTALAGREGPAPPAVKVLFVDDEEDFVRTLAERMGLRELGGEVALSGEAALAMVEEDRPDVMVLDLRMPGIDGMEVLRRVKEAHPGVQVVILTGHGSARDEAEARRLGAFAYLHKPMDLAVLMETVRQAARVPSGGARGPDTSPV